MIHGEHGGLGDGRLHQGFFGLLDCGLVVGIDEDDRAQPSVDVVVHDAVRLVEDIPHDGFGGTQLAQHVHVLRALAGVEERYLGGRSTAAIDPTGSQCLPARRILALEHFDGSGCLGGQLFGVAVIDGEPFRRPKRRLGRWRRWGGVPSGGVRLDLLELGEQRSLVRGAQDQGPARGRLGLRGRRGARSGHGRTGASAALARQQTRNVLFHHDVEIGAAETERAHACATRIG